MNQSGIDTLDLMRDEFIRIKSIANDDEIKGLCNRAISNITQRYPVISQRDKLESRVMLLESVLGECIEMLLCVRTGDDFECKCWTLAERALEHLKSK